MPLVGVFFTTGWNIFDFVIIGIALVPSSGNLSVLRSLRILRGLRLITYFPSMRRVVAALMASIPGISSVITLLSLVYYIFGVMVTKLFGEVFPAWFGTIGKSMYSLFQIMTLESWSMVIVRPVMEIFPHAWIVFVTFILITSFAVINLFIAVIVNAMTEQGNLDSVERKKDQDSVREDEYQALMHKIEALNEQLDKIKEIVAKRLTVNQIFLDYSLPGRRFYTKKPSWRRTSTYTLRSQGNFKICLNCRTIKPSRACNLHLISNVMQYLPETFVSRK